MPRKHRTACTRCHKVPGDTIEEAKRNLVAKKIEFRRYGFKGAVIRSRTVAWLCWPCMRSDADYNRPEHEISDRMVE